MKNLSIRGKLVLLGASSVVGVLFLGLLGIFNARTLVGNLDNLTAHSVPLIRHIALVDMVHDGVRGVALNAALGAAVHDSTRIKEAQGELEEMSKNAKTYLTEIASHPASEEFKSLLTSATGKMDEYLKSCESVIGAASSGDLRNTKAQLDSFQAKFEELEKSLEAFGEFSEQENTKIFENASVDSKRSQALAFFAMIIALCAGAALAWYTAKTTTAALKEIAENLSQGSRDVGSAIVQLSASSESLSASSTQQASALQETAASLEEITAMVKRSAENAASSEEASGKSRERAQYGQEVVSRVASSMDEINRTNENVVTEMNASNERIAEIVKVIQEIDGKTRVINDIVFQTKLLSFNASVEAARAGEHGKGFAVVAEEVGNLAAMSGTAAKEIGALLDESIQKAESIVQETKSKVDSLMTTARETVSNGAKVAEECSQVLGEIVENATKVSELMAGISTANQEQAHGVEEISKAIQLLDKSTQTSASASTSNSKSVSMLSEQMTTLRQAAASLRKMVDGTVAIESFVWKDEYTLGVDEMDGEHKILISKINDLATALSAGKVTPTVKAAFAEMARYTQEHFAHEEAYQASIGFPEIRGHKELHRRLLEQVGGFGAQVEAGTIDPQALMSFINDWLIKHILGVDMKYADFSRNGGTTQKGKPHLRRVA